MAAIGLSCGDCPPGKAVRDGAFATGNLYQAFIIITIGDEDGEGDDTDLNGPTKEG